MGEVTTTEHGGYVEYCFCGVFDDEGVSMAFQDLWTADEFDRKKLYDLTDADFKQITNAVKRNLMNLRGRIADTNQHPIAVLVEDDLTFGFARMFSSLSAELTPNIMVFRDRVEAIAWISSEGVLGTTCSDA